MAFSHRRIDLQHDSSRTAKAVREPLEGQRARTDLEPLADYRSRQHRFVERILCDLVAAEQPRVRSMQIWPVTVPELEGVDPPPPLQAFPAPPRPPPLLPPPAIAPPHPHPPPPPTPAPPPAPPPPPPPPPHH